MGTSAIAHFKYDLDKHATSLRRVASLASTFFLKDPFIKSDYLREVEDYNSFFGMKNTNIMLNELL
ncbi:hypothetical protein AVJ25_03630 [Yersinia pestis]|nr:hypothetical protein AUL40_04725 [Yersinia pestis]KZB81233.1 hypothetical protein AVJ24_05265 [Yersinia pestis]KZB89082.1 hypothetical protein AVJ25_03630 [Yersinia pestis]PCN64788.1 hypothetical protein A8V21_05005 [Yersinia pestis]